MSRAKQDEKTHKKESGLRLKCQTFKVNFYFYFHPFLLFHLGSCEEQSDLPGYGVWESSLESEDTVPDDDDV